MDEIIGKRFNRLVVIADSGKRTKQRTRIMRCLCDCGNYKEIAREKLRHGTKSCGCLKKENLKPRYGEFHENWQGFEDISKSFSSRIKACAKQRNLEYNLTEAYLWELFVAQNKSCVYSGIKLEMPKHVRKLRDKYDGNLASLDRKDNTRGYVEGNVQWICKRLNYMKHTMSETEFLQWINAVSQHINRKNSIDEL
jgi:hypothetical protein